MQGAEAVWEISKILTFSSERTPPANTSTVQKYGPSSNGSGQGVSWVQFCPKQLVSISHPTPDLIRPRSNFHLSVFNPKSQIAMHMTRKWNRSKKNVFKWTKINAEPFKTSTLAISDNFSINKSHLGPSRRLPTKRRRKNPKFWHFLQSGPPLPTYQRFKNMVQTLLHPLRIWLGHN